MEVKEATFDEIPVEEEFQIDDTGNGPPPPIDDNNGDGFGGSNGDFERQRRNAFIAMILFLGADIMLFAGLIGSFIVFKFGAEVWPPPEQPRLPLDVTVANTLVLLFSGVFMIGALKLLKTNDTKKIKRVLFAALILGITFLGIQGYEWLRLINHGITMQSGVFGGTFYLLIGCHALHFIVAVIWLAIATAKFTEAYLQSQKLRISLSGMYWLVVVFLWPVLFIFVYL